ncbi:MAG: hypothetical protein RL033_1887 [Pseudomonadota bacterium]
MIGASTCRRWAYVGCCCAVLTLIGCPQLLPDDFLVAVGGAGASGTTGLGSGGAAGDAGPGTAGAAGEQPDASSGGRGEAGTGTCSDGARNQDETGVDCGGACAACSCVFGPFQEVVQVEGLSADDRYGPALSPDGQWLYLSAIPAGGTEDLYRARRGASSVVLTDLEPLPNLNGTSLEGSPFLTRDGLTLFFFSDRTGGSGSRDLWLARRASTSEEFANPAPVPGVNSSDMDLLPRLSPDGLTLLFESTRAGASGSSDIWEAVRSSASGAFGAPRPRSDLNTAAREEGFTLSADQRTIILSSSRGTGDLNLFVGTRSAAGANFGALQPIAELNSAEDDLDPFLSADGREIYFVSTRDGDYRIYHAQRDCL